MPKFNVERLHNGGSRAMIRSGDKIRALPGTVADIFAEGRIGVVTEARDPKPYSGNDSNNLVRWGDDTISLGFHPEDVETVK